VIYDHLRLQHHILLPSTLFNGAREGAELLFLLIISAVAVIYGIIGLVDYAGMWKPIETGLAHFLGMIGGDPKSGITSIMVSPT
jgi:hypothetical protein